MSIFIAELGFAEQEEALLMAKTGFCLYHYLRILVVIYSCFYQ
jgi:hypothetical protein